MQMRSRDLQRRACAEAPRSSNAAHGQPPTGGRPHVVRPIRPFGSQLSARQSKCLKPAVANG